jgi:G3E family GTPase
MTAAAPIPVTVVSGYLGAGKTTLVNHVLETTERRIAVLVNDMGEVNVDADLVARESESEGIVDLSNGCICCELRGDLVDAVERLAESRAFDYLLVESSGISEPVPVAKTFLDEEVLSEFRLDTLVSVIDSRGFDAAFGDGEFPERDERVERGGRHPTEVMIDQVECCDVLLLNKRDRLPEEAMDRVESVVSRLAPRAEIVRTEFSEIDPDRILDTGRFDLAEMQRSAGWKRELAHAGESEEAHHDHDHSPATAFGVESFVSRYEKPFHPERLDEAFSAFADDESIIRAKGVFLLAGREEEVMGFSQAGDAVRAGPIGRWDPERDEPRSELVFIGRGMDEGAIRERLEGSLADEDEREVPRTADPFPR